MAVLTTDKVDAEKWTDLDTDQVHAGQHARQLVGRLPQGEAAERQGAAGRDQRRHGARAWRRAAPTRIVENIDFFLAFTKNYPDVKWRTLDDTIFVAYCAIGVSQGQ